MKYLIALVLFVSLLVYLAAAQTSVSLTVAAQGTAPFTYKWTKDGLPLASTANPLLLSPLSVATTGTYQATVINAAGTATSAPAAVIVTASSTAGPDLSKQYLEAILAAPWIPKVTQWEEKDGFFVVVPLKKVDDPGNHFNDATGIYTVGPGEAGIYQVQMSVRAVDQPPNDVSIGITAGTTNKDDKTGWGNTPSKSSSYVHFGFDHPVTRRYKDGDQIRCNIFVAAAITIQSFDVTVRRLP